jgi:hypothetical protein
MEYRLGEAKARELYAALDALTALAERPGISHIVLKPESRINSAE